MSQAFDPYHTWLGIPPGEQPADHYRLLGVERFEADPDVIAAAADRQIAYVRSLRSGEHLRRAQQLLEELEAARACLLDAGTKAAYDINLRAQPAPTTGADRTVARPAPRSTSTPPPGPPPTPPSTGVTPAPGSPPTGATPYPGGTAPAGGVQYPAVPAPPGTPGPMPGGGYGMSTAPSGMPPVGEGPGPHRPMAPGSFPTNAPPPVTPGLPPQPPPAGSPVGPTAQPPIAGPPIESPPRTAPPQASVPGITVSEPSATAGGEVAAQRGASSRQGQLWLLIGIVGVVMLGTALAIAIIASGTVDDGTDGADRPEIFVPMQGKLVIQQANGSLYFTADDAIINGDSARLETVAGRSAITHWTSQDDWLSWDFQVDQPAVFRVEVIYATPPGSGGKFSVAIRDMKEEALVRDSGGAQTFTPHEIGFLTVRRSGRHQLAMRVIEKPVGQLLVLRAVQLTPRVGGHVR